MEHPRTSGLPASGSGKPSPWNAGNNWRKTSAKSKREKDAVKGDASGVRPEEGAEMDGGVTLTTSEILDFSEGTDSTP